MKCKHKRNVKDKMPTEGHALIPSHQANGSPFSDEFAFKYKQPTNITARRAQIGTAYALSASVGSIRGHIGEIVRRNDVQLQFACGLRILSKKTFLSQFI